VDGVRQKRVTWWKGKVPDNSFDLTIGIIRMDPVPEYGEVGPLFEGLIDEPTIWNCALSKKEAAFLFQSQNGSSVGKTKAH
jgi:hypothetical protein